MTAPEGLEAGGSSLWDSITADHELDAMQTVQLTEACRAKDRLDKLDELLRGDIDVWARVMYNTRTEDYELKIDAALSQANSTANLLKQLLAALRLADSTGKRPQVRSARGAYSPSAKGGASVSSIDRARSRQTGA